MNRLVLGATLAERGAMRFTPAGLPALDLVLAHEAEVLHEGQVRKVSMQLKALAVGSTVAAVMPLALGSAAVYGGFLAPARNGRGLLFHITDVQA
jgi:primosomal replication protein N